MSKIEHNVGGHQHDDDLQRQLYESVVLQYQTAVMAGRGCEFVHALFDVVSGVLAAREDEARETLLDALRNAATLIRADHEASAGRMN